MSEEYFNFCLKEFEITKQFSAYMVLNNSVLFEGNPIDEWECKDNETAKRLAEHLKKLEHKSHNQGMLATACQLGQLTDDEYHKLKSIIYRSMRGKND